MSEKINEEKGYKWWLRYVIVPLIGGGGVIALIVALLGQSQPSVAPTPTYAADAAISIEEFPGEIFNFSGNSGYAELHVIRKANDDFDYLFYYRMPESGDGYAGIFFRFTPTVNFTDFAFLQVTVSFGDENAICEIYLEDQDSRKSYVALWNNKLVNASADARIEIDGNNRVFTIPIADNFLDVPNKQSIAGIGISINTNVLRGSHSCTIQQIYLLK
jgi:hypothetical protein